MFSPAHLRAPGRDRAILTGSLVAIAALAWLALWLWEGSPYGHFLHHEVVGGVSTSVAVGAVAFTVGWTLMIVAMMLPSSVPLVVTFAALVGRRARPGRLVVLLLLGYLLVWGGFGLAAWAADRGVHAAVDALPWLAAHPQLILGRHPARGRPVAVQPAPRPLPRRVPQPAGVRAEPLARRVRAPRGAG